MNYRKLEERDAFDFAQRPRTEADLIRIPLYFFWDHESRELPTPVLVRRTKTNGWVDRLDPALPELISDARYYAEPYGPGDSCPDLRTGAYWLLKALEKGGAL